MVYLVSAMFGVITLGALAGNLHHKESPSIYALNIRAPLIVQMLTFMAAIVCTIVFATKAL